MPVDCGGDVRPCLPCVPRVNDVCAACELLVVFSTFHNPRWELTFEFYSDKLPRQVVAPGTYDLSDQNHEENRL